MKKVLLSLQKITVTDFAVAAIGSILAVFVFLPNSQDIDNYLTMFDERSAYPIDLTLTSEFLFWRWAQWVGSLGGSLYLALMPLSLLTLLLKLRAFRFFGVSSFCTYICYFCIFYLLHDCTQIRISFALAFALWACVYIKHKQWWLVALLSFLSLGFHITAPLLPLMFAACQNKTICKYSWLALIAGIFAFIGQFSIMETTIAPIIGLLGGSYLDYIAPTRLETQNASGLMFIYAFLLSILLLCLHCWKQLNPRHNTHLFSTCLAVCVYGTALMFWFYDTVAVASRLADILTLLMVPLLATAISTSQAIFRYLSFSILLLFFAMRMVQLF